MKTLLLHLFLRHLNRSIKYGCCLCAIFFINLSFTLVSFAQNKVWDKTIGGNEEDNLQIIQQTSDGGYILGGTSSSSKSGDKSQSSYDTGNESSDIGDYWIIKLKADGTKAWDKTIGGDGRDELTSLRQTTDGGYIVGGYSNSTLGGDKTEASKGNFDFWIVKLNVDGEKEWDKTFGGDGYDELAIVQQTSDGGYILGGTSSSNISGDKTEGVKGEGAFPDYWIIKLNTSHTKIWDKTFGGSTDDILTYIQQTGDGGYIVGGSSSSGKDGDKSEENRDDIQYYSADYWVLKLTSSGIKVWDKTLGGYGWEYLKSVQETKDGGYILGGTSSSRSDWDKSEDNRGAYRIPDFWIVKLHANGSKTWDKTIGGDEREDLKSLQLTKDGGYLLGGSSLSGVSGEKTEGNKGKSDYWVVKLQEDGLKVWDKTIGGPEEDVLPSVWQTSDGGYILGGISSSQAGGDKSEASKGATDYWIAKINNKIQGIVFAPIPDKPYDDFPFTLSARASSGLPVSFSLVSGPATLKGNIISLTGLGTVIIKATQAGNASYNPATSIQSFNVVAFKRNESKLFGGSKSDYLRTMIPTPDGGFLLGGFSESETSGDKTQNSRGSYDYWVVKTDKSGKKLWDKTFGGKEDDFLYELLATVDGGYLLGGSSLSGMSGDKSQVNKGQEDYWIVKIDEKGNKMWDKAIGGNNSDLLSAMVTTADGGFLLGGTSESNKSGDQSQINKGGTDYWVVKIDANGNKIWNKTYGGSGSDNLVALVKSNDGGYLLGGTSSSDISGDKSQSTRGKADYWVVRIDVNGLKVWDKAYGGIQDYYIDSMGSCDPECYKHYFGESVLSVIIPTPDGGFLLGGSSNAEKGSEKSEGNLAQDNEGWDEYLYDYWIIKIDAKGNRIWDKTLGGTKKITGNHEQQLFFSGSSTLNSAITTPEGGFILAGYSNADKGKDKSQDSDGQDYWIIKIDGNGNKLSDQIIDGSYSIILPSGEGGYLLGGVGSGSPSLDQGEADFLLLKLDEIPPSTSAWNLRYGGSGNEGFTAIIKTSDGGYLSGGYTNSGVSGDKTQASQGKNDYWIVKSDAAGKKIWDKRYGGAGDEYLNRIIQTQDGGYLLAGSSLSGTGGDKTQASRGDRDYWIVKISNTGVKQWDKRFGGSGYDELKKVMQLSTGEYILAGYSNSPVGGDKSQNSRGGQDYWLVKVSSKGTKIWDKRYGGNLNEALGGIVQTPGGGFLLGGGSFSGKGGDKSEVSRGGSDFWLISLDKNGNKLWDKTYGGSGEDEAYSLGRSGNEYFISGQSDSPAGADKTRGPQGGKDFWFLKLTSTGAKIWDKRFGGTLDEELRAAVQTSDGGYLLAGKSFSGKSGNKTQDSQGNSDYWIVKTDKDGMYQWDKRYGGRGAEELRAVIQVSDGGLLLAGKSASEVSGDRTQPSQGGTDFWLVKVAPETIPLVATREATVAEEKPIVNTNQVMLTAAPNPFQENLRVSFSLPETQRATVKVYDSQGREITTLFQGEAKAQQTYQVEWQATNKATGLYFLQLQTPTKRHQHKLLLAR